MKISLFIKLKVTIEDFAKVCWKKSVLVRKCGVSYFGDSHGDNLASFLTHYCLRRLKISQHRWKRCIESDNAMENYKSPVVNRKIFLMFYSIYKSVKS